MPYREYRNGGIFILLMYLHLGAPRLFVTILYINSGYDRLSYLYMPQYRFPMQLDATRKNSGYETIVAFICVYDCRYDLLEQGELRPDADFNITIPASYSGSFGFESRFVGWLLSLRFSVVILKPCCVTSEIVPQHST